MIFLHTCRMDLGLSEAGTAKGGLRKVHVSQMSKNSPKGVVGLTPTVAGVAESYATCELTSSYEYERLRRPDLRFATVADAGHPLHGTVVELVQPLPALRSTLFCEQGRRAWPGVSAT